MVNHCLRLFSSDFSFSFILFYPYAIAAYVGIMTTRVHPAMYIRLRTFARYQEMVAIQRDAHFHRARFIFILALLLVQKIYHNFYSEKISYQHKENTAATTIQLQQTFNTIEHKHKHEIQYSLPLSSHSGTICRHINLLSKCLHGCCINPRCSCKRAFFGKS